MIFVDTAFLVATLDPRDGLYATARDWASRTRGPFLLTEHVLTSCRVALDRQTICE
jgi:hypothetical protein